MLGMKEYPKEQVEGCRARMDAQLDTYRALVAAADGDAAVAAFEQPFLQHLVIVLDAYFVHRVRGLEGKDGNPLNEVRILTESILTGGGTVTVPKAIAYKPEAAVMGLAPGEPITLDLDGFTRLANAFFDEIEARYT